MLEQSGQRSTGGGNTEDLDRRRLERLVEVGRALVSQLELEPVLRRVLETARELTGARYAALGILDDRRQELERFLTLGIDEQARAAIGDLPRGRGVLGVLISDPKPLRLSDVNRHAQSYGFPPGHPPMRTFLGVPILIRGEAYGNLYLTDKEGGEFDEADEQATLILAEWAAIAIDNARLYKAVWDRRQHLETAVQGLQATTEIARALGGETRLERVLELIVKRGRALVEAESVVILLREDDDLVVSSLAGQIAAGAPGQRIDGKLFPWKDVLATGAPLRMNDLTSHPAVTAGLGITASCGLLVPLSFRGEQLGVLAAFDRTVAGPDFSDRDEDLMRGFAASAATAVHTAKSVGEERLRRSIEASEQERRRWARELHDETLQALGALQMILSSALRTGSSENMAAAVRDAVDHIGVEIRNLRRLITELRPAALDEIGLGPAIESLADRTAQTEGISLKTSIDLPGDGQRLAPELESTIYRVAQEALTNVAKHAQASEARIALKRSDGTVVLHVSDDGVGHDPNAPSSGFGLKGMRERVELAGGRLDISSAPGQGTSVTAVFAAPD